MFKIGKSHIAATLLTSGMLGSTCIPASAAVRIDGQVKATGSPVAGSTVTLWAASASEPRQLAQAQTGADGRFSVRTNATPGSDVADEALTTRCGGQGVVIFFGMAKPVRAPQIGPASQL